MKNFKKTLCELDKKDIDKFQREIKKSIKNPKFMCKKCFRACSEKELLCKPEKL